jgi:hypothetical protein
MGLSEEELAEINEKLKQNGFFGCPVCQYSQLSAQGPHVLLRFENNAVKLGGPMLPVIPIVCQRCGHVALFSAIKLGILPSGNS